MVVRDTFLAELKTLFGLVVAGFEPGFSDPKAHALPLRQSYAVNLFGYCRHLCILVELPHGHMKSSLLGKVKSCKGPSIKYARSLNGGCFCSKSTKGKFIVTMMS